MKIKSVLNILKEIKYLKSVLSLYGDSLVVGKYHLFDGFRSMALNDPEAIKRANPYFTKPGVNSRMASIARKLNQVGYFKNKNRNSTEEYEAFYTANNYDKVREVKLFSFAKKKMMTICVNSAQADEQISQYHSFGNVYDMPKVKKVEKYPNAIEIAMIDLQKRPDEKFALESIACSGIRARSLSQDVPKTVPARELLQASYQDLNMNEILEKLISQIDPSILDIEIPVCIQHGDLSKDNLLYGISDKKESFWWIDWEHVGQRVFFYDYYFYILNSAFYYDIQAYDCYFSQAVDQKLAEFFESFGIPFMPQHKKDYFLLFTIVFLKERICDKNNLIALNSYYDFICKYITEQEN